MPLIKRDVAAAAAPSDHADDFAAHVAALNGPEAEARWSAARALSGRAAALPALAAALSIEQVPRVRESIMTAIMRIGDEAGVMVLLPYLRSQNAAERAATLETPAGPADRNHAVHGIPVGGRRHRCAYPGDGISAKYAGGECNPGPMRVVGTRAASQCLRRGDRCIGGGWDPRRHPVPSGLR